MGQAFLHGQGGNADAIKINGTSKSFPCLGIDPIQKGDFVAEVEPKETIKSTSFAGYGAGYGIAGRKITFIDDHRFVVFFTSYDSNYQDFFQLYVGTEQDRNITFSDKYTSNSMPNASFSSMVLNSNQCVVHYYYYSSNRYSYFNLFSLPPEGSTTAPARLQSYSSAKSSSYVDKCAFIRLSDTQFVTHESTVSNSHFVCLYTVSNNKITLTDSITLTLSKHGKFVKTAFGCAVVDASGSTLTYITIPITSGTLGSATTYTQTLPVSEVESISLYELSGDKFLASIYYVSGYNSSGSPIRKYAHAMFTLSGSGVTISNVVTGLSTWISGSVVYKPNANQFMLLDYSQSKITPLEYNESTGEVIFGESKNLFNVENVYPSTDRYTSSLSYWVCAPLPSCPSIWYGCGYIIVYYPSDSTSFYRPYHGLIPSTTAARKATSTDKYIGVATKNASYLGICEAIG